MELVVFVVAAAICLFGAVGVVFSRNSVHSALSLVATLFGIAVLFIAQDAELLASVQVIVYAGSIVVLFLFVIMLLGVDQSEDLDVEPLAGQRVAAVVAGALIIGGLSAVFLLGDITGVTAGVAPIDDTIPNVEQVGRALFTDYLWAFEITSVLLVIAVVGAVTLTRHSREAYIDLDDDPSDTPEEAS